MEDKRRRLSDRDAKTSMGILERSVRNLIFPRFQPFLARSGTIPSHPPFFYFFHQFGSNNSIPAGLLLERGVCGRASEG